MCIEPPLPFAQPPCLPSSSQSTPVTVSPRESCHAWSRYDVMTESPHVAPASMPTQIASCPSYRWQKPLTCLALYSVSAEISIRRMRYISE